MEVAVRQPEGGEIAESEEKGRDKPGENSVNMWADRTEDVAAVELSGGQEI